MVYVFDEFQFDAEQRELRRFGRVVKAEALALRLLGVLLRRAGDLVTKQELGAEVWDGRPVADNALTVAITRLRKLLGQDRDGREFIINVHGRGYRVGRETLVRLTERAVPASLPANLSATPFVGRERELARLRVAFGETFAARGSACVLIGEPGSGKTRLAEVVEREAVRAGMMVAWGYCRESGGAPPLWPFARLIRDLMQKVAGTPPRPHELELVAQLQSVSALLERAAEMTSAARDGSAFSGNHSATYRLFDAVTHALSLVARHTPCVLVLDDLHRADPTSLQLILYWIDALARTPILLIGTMHSVIDRQTPAGAQLARLIGHRNCTRVELEPLPEPAVAAYVGARLDDPDGALARAVFQTSEGNAFYMVELLRQLICQDVPSPEHLVIPTAALDLAHQRVMTLREGTRRVLSCAAVIGRNFELSLLQTLSGLDAAAVMAGLDEALTHDIVRRTVGSHTAFAFAHDLLRAALYEALPPVSRRKHHLSAALALEQRLLGGDAVPAADLAHHFGAALPDTDLRKTVAYYSQAAATSAAVCTFSDGMRYLRQARTSLDLIDKPSQRLRLDLALRQAMYARVCSSPDFRSSIDEVIGMARARGSGTTLARAGFLLDLHPGFPPLRGAREVFDDALQLLPSDDVATRAVVMARLATSAPAAFSRERATEQAGRALELSRGSNSLPALFAVQFARLYLMGGPTQTSRADQLLAESERACERSSDTLSVAPALIELHRCITALQLGDLTRTRDALERCEAFCRKLGSRELMWHVERFRILWKINAGRRSSKETGALRALHRRAERETIIGSELFCAYDRTVVLREPWRSSEDVRRAFSHDAGDPPSIWSLKIRGLAQAGLHEEARKALFTCDAAQLAQLPCDRDHLGTLGALARAALVLGAREYLQAVYALLEPHAECFSVHLSFLCEGSVAQLLGMLALGLGRRPDAIRHFEAGAAISARAGLARAVAEARAALEACRRAR